MITIEIPGPVQPKQRPRFTSEGRAYTPTATSKYESYAAIWAKKAMSGKEPLRGYISLTMQILEEMPKNFSKLKISRALSGDFFPTRSDLDNQIKILGDSCNGIVWIDDRQIVHIRATRSYGEKSTCLLQVREISNASEIE